MNNSGGDQSTQGPEPGLAAVSVRLYLDRDGNGQPDDLNGDGAPDRVAGTVTDGAGQYLFRGLPFDTYLVEVDTATLPVGFGATPTYDPDGGADSRSQVTIDASSPHNRAQDFSYTKPGVGSIGDTIWGDLDSSGGDQSTQGAEPGLPAVRVSLYDAGNALVATTFTDLAGNYLFAGLPAGTYTVAVDTGTLPGYVRTVPTYELDGGTDSRASISIGAGNPHPRTLDFSYPPAAQGLIGDTVWFDLDNSGGDQSTQGAEPGIEGVVMELLVNGRVVRTTTTDENGHYAFGNLLLDTTYQVRVAAANFAPGGVLEGVSNTYDPDGGNDGLGPQITLTPASPINLDQDFSYTTTDQPGRIGNLVWLDANADGLFTSVNGPDGLLGSDDDEPVLGGVTLDLYRDLNGNGRIDPGEPRISTQSTASAIDGGLYGPDGVYIFNRLPAGSYVVNVSDAAGLLHGYWHSLGAAGADNHSQVNPYAVALAAGGENLTADFGYFVEPACLGNFVWYDEDEDGLQGAPESGFDDVPVQLVITYPTGATTTLRVVTGDNPTQAGAQQGWYSFCNLLLDEDYRLGSSAGAPAPNQPAHVISVPEAPTGYSPTRIGGADGDETTGPLNDSNNHAGTVCAPVQGLSDVLQRVDPNDEPAIASYDFGFKTTPLAVLLAGFDASAQPDHILVTWETVSEVDNAGFNLYRSLSPSDQPALLGFTPSAAPGSSSGAAYHFQDFDVQPGLTYWYRLEAIDVNGAATLFDPVSVTFVGPTAVTLSSVEASPAVASSLPLAGALLALVLAPLGAAWARRRS